MPPESAPPEEKRPSRLIWWAGLLVLLFAGATAALALGLRHKTKQEASSLKNDGKSGMKVDTANVTVSAPERTLLLLGETRPFYSVTLYARVSGYMDALYVDIGDRVKAGQALAHVVSPETEQAYNSARANAINLKKISLRNRDLIRRKLISQQEADQAFANADVAEANVRTEAVLRGYQQILAPFDGIISNRFVDPGALLQNASGSQAASQPLFTLTQADPLRVFMYVDQKDAPYVKVGDAIDVMTVDQTQGPAPKTISAHVDKIAAELDSRTRTLLVEAILDNHENAIVPGGFIQVKMHVHTPSYLALPTQALVMRGQKTFVPVVEQGKLRFAPIDLAENDGESILIRSGVEKGQTVALNVGNTLKEGQTVRTENQNQMAGTVGGTGK